MPIITHFEEIEAWQTARKLNKLIYVFTDEIKFSLDAGLKDQIRNASVLIMSSIAKGFESQSQAQFIHCLGDAKASAAEVRSQLHASLDLNYLTEEQASIAYRTVEKTSRQLAHLISYLESNPQAQKPHEGSVRYEI